MSDCCERYTDKETKQCVLCGCHSKNDDDFQAVVEYLNTNFNNKNGELK
ncbi:hypothetical protein [Halomonas sp. HL-93]|nr:hypothetical protein [Halomonas sp. HL-93]SBR45125.1 hypothetical protein GA0071314_0084 [Halomonas sp. HL-93]